MAKASLHKTALKGPNYRRKYMIIIYYIIIIILFHPNQKKKTKPTTNGNFTPSIGGFVELKAESSKPKANFLNY